jgi:sialidase-1
MENFNTEIASGPFDGNLHSMAVKRAGDKFSIYYDDKKLHEQPVDPDVHLHLWFDAMGNTCKIKSIKLTADKLSDKLKAEFKSAAPIEEIFVGSGVRPKPEYGKACRYRIPALAVSKKGTILAFAEARRVGGADVGDIDAVVRRSEDGGKTWGPEIVVWDDGANSINNPCPIVDPKNGRIWCCMGRYNPYPNANQHVVYSDDDGKTWSKPRDITQAIQATIEPKKKCWIPGPGAGLVMRHEKYAGRLVIPMGFAPLVVYSDDNGETWKGGGWGGSDGGEAKCAELLDGSLLFNGRTGQKKRALSIVTEGGTKNAEKTWYADDLPDPSCQGAIIRHSWPTGGKPGLLLYSGPGVDAARAQGTLFGSYDDGKTWPWKQTYYEGGSGYSDACVLPDGRVAVLFEKDGKSNLGFTILPAPPAEPPAK